MALCMIIINLSSDNLVNSAGFQLTDTCKPEPPRGATTFEGQEIIASHKKDLVLTVLTLPYGACFISPYCTQWDRICNMEGEWAGKGVRMLRSKDKIIERYVLLDPKYHQHVVHYHNGHPE